MSTKHEQNDGDTPEVVTVDPDIAHTTFEGEPNGLPPAAPEVALGTPEEVKALREWFHFHVKNSVHSEDTTHYNNVYRMTEALAATLHSKHPVQKET